MTWDTVLDVLLDTLKDAALIFPVLFVAYFVMELVEKASGDRLEKTLAGTSRFGPLLGALFGVVPECGFAAAAGGLYAGGVITMGTMLAVFLSTSDELIPIFLSEGASQMGVLIKVILIKVAVGVAVGYLVDLFWRLRHRADAGHIHEVCEREHCGCDDEKGGPLKSAFIHSAKIILLIMATSLLLGLLVAWVGEENIAKIITDIPVVGEMAAGLIGLIPNCAASVLITELYLKGIISGGALLSGLLVSAGTGVLVLFRMHRPKRDCFLAAGILYAAGVLGGVSLGFLI